MNKIQLYALEGSSYDGCNGWESWIMEDSITANYDEICKLYKEKSGSGFFKVEIIKYKEITI